jgi:LemA protein
MFKRLLGLAVVAGLALGLAGCGFNTIPTKDEQVKAAFSEVQNQYKRRSDLIGNLVRTVEGAAIQERTTLVEVAEARARATQVTVDASTITDPEKFKQFQEAQGAMDRPLGRLMMISERYPQLQTNQNFLALQSQLEGTENRIAIARRDYNLAAQDYNTTLRTFPTVIWAKTMYSDQKPAVYFDASPADEATPEVGFPSLSAAASK